MCLTIRKNVLRIADKNNSEAHIQDELKIRNLWQFYLFYFFGNCSAKINYT